jgi:hypothetical protein
MARYFIVAVSAERAWDWLAEYPLLPGLQCAEHVATDTGLLDGNGRRIMRAPNPMGFGKDSEW